MLKINLATKPGLQEENDSKTGAISIDEVFAVKPPVTEAPETSEEPISRQVEQEQPAEVPALEDDMFASIESNLEMLEQAESEEFVPKHVSLPPKKQAEQKQEEKIEKLAKKPSHRRLLKILTLVLVIAIIGGGGYWAYLKFFMTPTGSTTDYEKPAVVAEPSGPSPVETTPAPSESPQTEDLQPVYQPPAQLMLSASQTTPPVTIPPQASQIEDAYASQILRGAGNCQTLARVIGMFPVDFRLRYLKMRDDKISFLIYVVNEDEAKRMKAGLQSLPGILTEVFYIERMAGIAAPAVQIMAIFKLRTEPAESRGFRFYDDVGLSQVLWSIGKRINLGMQPLSITEPPADKPRLAEIRGNGSSNGIANLLQELATIDLSLSIEQVSLLPSDATTGNAGVLDFTINSRIYPQKL